MALTNQPKRLQVASSLGLFAKPMYHGQEKATQTYKAGALVQDDDAGRITESTSPVNGAAVANRTIGMVLQDASGVTDKDVPIIAAGPQLVLEGTLSDSTAGTGTIAQLDMWKVYPITKATANWYLDKNAVSDTGGGVVVGFKDPIGTVDGRVYFKVTTPAIGGLNAGSANY